MKKFVILLDLKEEFVIGRLLGRGNFAKVHLCSRKTDLSTKYALKTMQKSALSKSKRNIVSAKMTLIYQRCRNNHTSHSNILMTRFIFEPILVISFD